MNQPNARNLHRAGYLGLSVLSALLISCTSGQQTKETTSAPDLSAPTSAATSYPDLRSYQHGLDFLKLNSGDYYAIFASNGLPPKDGEAGSGSWGHDIYFASITASNPSLGATTGTKWLSGTEAQEPASSAINASGTKICTTWEDGNPNVINNDVGQRVYVSSLPLSGNPYSSAKTIYDGGHSGHAAAVGENFVVFWCDNWTDGGGVDGLGSGNTNYISTVSSIGTIGSKFKVSSGRTWWPIVAGSATKACLVWQKFVSGQVYSDLYFGIFDPATKTMTKAATKLQGNQLYYHYSVKYVPSIDRFLVTASKDGGAGSNSGRKCSGGAAWLIDNSGTIKATASLTDGVIRESRIIINGSTAVQARLKNGNSVFGANSSGGATGGIMVMKLTASSITVSQTVDDTYAWYYMGNDGFFKDSTHVFISAMSPSGIRSKTYTINP